MSNIVKRYFKKRKDSKEVFAYRESGELIIRAIPKLLYENKEHKIEYFIKTCQLSKNELYEKYVQEKIIISKELIPKIKQLEITDLYDCKSYGEILLILHAELAEKQNSNVFCYPTKPIGLTVLEMMLLILAFICIVKLIPILT